MRDIEDWLVGAPAVSTTQLEDFEVDNAMLTPTPGIKPINFFVYGGRDDRLVLEITLPENVAASTGPVYVPCFLCQTVYTRDVGHVMLATIDFGTKTVSLWDPDAQFNDFIYKKQLANGLSALFGGTFESTDDANKKTRQTGALTKKCASLVVCEAIRRMTRQPYKDRVLSVETARISKNYYIENFAKCLPPSCDAFKLDYTGPLATYRRACAQRWQAQYNAPARNGRMTQSCMRAKVLHKLERATGDDAFANCNVEHLMVQTSLESKAQHMYHKSWFIAKDVAVDDATFKLVFGFDDFSRTEARAPFFREAFAAYQMHGPSLGRPFLPSIFMHAKDKVSFPRMLAKLDLKHGALPCAVMKIGWERLDVPAPTVWGTFVSDLSAEAQNRAEMNLWTVRQAAGRVMPGLLDAIDEAHARYLAAKIVVLTVPHAACVDESDHACDPDALAAAEHLRGCLTREFMRRGIDHDVQLHVCDVKRKTEGDCNRAGQPLCKPWQDAALAATGRANIHLDVHSCNDRTIYTITRPEEYARGSRNTLQRLLTKHSDGGIEVRQGTDANYMIMQSRCPGDRLLLEFSNDDALNLSWAPTIARAICDACTGVAQRDGPPDAKRGKHGHAGAAFADA